MSLNAAKHLAYYKLNLYLTLFNYRRGGEKKFCCWILLKTYACTCIHYVPTTCNSISTEENFKKFMRTVLSMIIKISQ